jgi:hypothetical protein
VPAFNQEDYQTNLGLYRRRWAQAFYGRNSSHERLSERSGIRMSVPTYRTNILYEICHDKVRMSGVTYSVRIRKSLAANGTVACLNPTASADVRTDIKGHDADN